MDNFKLIRLSVISSGKGNDNIKAAEYVITDEDMEFQFEKLSGHDKRLMNYSMKIALLKDTNK